MPSMSTALERLTEKLARLATHYDVLGAWPEESLGHLTAAGAWGWMVPSAYGGTPLDPASQILAYEAVASGCLATLLILTQRDGACELISSSDNEAQKRDLLPRLARNEVMTSVGISQLTTSHQGGRPALLAKPDGKGYRLHGHMPWVTSAAKCDFIVSGAALPDGKQILAVLPTDLPGLQVDAPMKLMALEGTLTSEVHCRDVPLDPSLVLAGPTGNALRRRSTVKSLVVAAAGLGLAGAMVRLIASHAQQTTGDLRHLADEAAARYSAMRDRVHKSADKLNQPDAEVPQTEVRVAVNDLVLRLAVATMTFSKGSGFIRQRDAQRLAREAMFFLVWSTPDRVRAATLTGFLDRPPPESKSMRV